MQEAVETLWGVLFHDYRLLKRHQLKMPRNWQPDIVACNYREDVILIIELKGKPPSGTKNQAIAQVAGYGLRTLEKVPEIALKLMVIGPWEGEGRHGVERFNGSDIMIMSIESLRDQVTSLLERMVCWCLNTPFPSLSPRPLLDDELKHLPLFSPTQYAEEKLVKPARQVPSPTPEAEPELETESR